MTRKADDMVQQVASIVLGLEPDRPCTFPQSSARSLHAALLRRIERFDPGTSALLHDAESGVNTVARAWTVSSLHGQFLSSRAGPVALPGRRYWGRVTALTSELIGTLDRVLASQEPGDMLHLERVPFRFVAPDETAVRAWASRTTYAQLLAEARPAPIVVLHWLTPTTFHRRGGFVGRPVPRQSLESYLRRWNAFAEPALTLDEAAVLANAEQLIQVMDVQLRQDRIHLGRFAVPGSVGQITWRCAPEPSDQLIRVNALAAYARYCGTGAKTAMGMGQTTALCQTAEVVRTGQPSRRFRP